MLGLCDLVLASSNAYFYCPYTKLGKSPVGCSSHTFTASMGRLQANAMIIFNRKLNADEVSTPQHHLKILFVKIPMYCFRPINSG